MVSLLRSAARACARNPNDAVSAIEFKGSHTHGDSSEHTTLGAPSCAPLSHSGWLGDLAGRCATHLAKNCTRHSRRKSVQLKFAHQPGHKLVSATPLSNSGSLAVNSLRDRAASKPASRAARSGFKSMCEAKPIIRAFGTEARIRSPWRRPERRHRTNRPGPEMAYSRALRRGRIEIGRIKQIDAS